MAKAPPEWAVLFYAYREDELEFAGSDEGVGQWQGYPRVGLGVVDDQLVARVALTAINRNPRR